MLKLQHKLKPRSFLTASHILIRCVSEIDFVRMWSTVSWDVFGCPMRTFKWTPEFDPKFEDSVVPVWIRLLGLPFHLFARDALFTVAAAVGKPLQVDALTGKMTRLAFARVCVEVDLQGHLPSSINLDLNGKCVILPVQYERLSRFCSACRHVGHEVSECYVAGNRPRPPPPVRRPVAH